MVRLFIVDDHAVVRSGLKSLLGEVPEMDVVGEAADGAEAVRECERLRPDVVLMDLSMPNGMDGMTATEQLKQRTPEIAVLVLTMHDDEQYLFRAIQAGASGYVLKSAPHDELLNAIRSVAAGNAYLTPTATKRLMGQYLDKMKPGGEEADVFATLSEREKEVLSWTAKGYANKEIAEMLIVSVKTVESHKSNLMEKLGLKTRPDLIKYAMKKGLLQFE
jgi:two-component system response regulator NreC